MNNKITIYELLGLVKDGQAPKRFIKDNVLWHKGESDTDHYYCENGKCQLNYIKLSELNDEIELIDNEVEILDNEDEEKIKVPTEEEVEMLGYKVAKIVKAYQKGVNIALEENDNEDEEKKIPEKLEDISEIKCVGCKVEIDIIGNKTLFDTDTPIVTEHCIYKINQLIKNQKKIIDYLKSKGE